MKQIVCQRWQRYHHIVLLTKEEITVKRTSNNKNIFWISAAMVLLVVCIGGVVSVPSQYGDILAATGSGLVQNGNFAGNLAGILNLGNSSDTAGMAIDAGGDVPGVGIIDPKDETGVAPGIAADYSGNDGDTTDTGGYGPGPKDETGVVVPNTISAVNPTNGVDPVNMQGVVIIPEFPTMIIPVIAMVGLLLLIQIKRKN